MFEALSSDARPDEHIAIGANLSLFGDPEPRPSEAFMAFTGGTALGVGAAVTEPAELATAAGDPGSSFQRRERLREERSKLVSQRARATRETHREINARINRAVGVRSVADATLEQLTKANDLLRRELERGR
jgi:hypothetical protein